REEAKVGARTTLDVLDAEQALFDAQTNRVIFDTQSQLAVYKLLASMGKLTSKDLGIASLYQGISNYSISAQSAPSYFSEESRKLRKILKRYGN
ncbi:MAG: transporter, partial [Paracoccaceae bacterium]